MFKLASTFARTGVIALGVLTGFGGMAITAPLGPIDRPALPVNSNLPIELAQGEFRGGTNPILHRFRGNVPRGGVNRAWRGGRNWDGNRAWRGGRNWNGNRAWRGNSNWRRNGNWRGNGNWKGRNWKGRGHYRNYRDYDDDDDFGIVLGLGLPLVGGYSAYPGYYGGYYPGYYGGYYPRRYYRTGNAHESWCYSRYRSYRAWDNTYQPYYGPRRECFSPYD